MNLRETAQNYEPPTTKNIADLELCAVDVEVKTSEPKKYTDKETGEEKEFSYNFIMHEGEEYRVPNTVLKQLKRQLKENPDLQNFTVVKEGSGLNTEYTVVPK